MIFRGFLCIIMAVVYLIWTALGIDTLKRTKGIEKIFPIIGIIIFGISMILFIVVGILYFKQSVLGVV